MRGVSGGSVVAFSIGVGMLVAGVLVQTFFFLQIFSFNNIIALIIIAGFFNIIDTN